MIAIRDVATYLSRSKMLQQKDTPFVLICPAGDAGGESFFSPASAVGGEDEKESRRRQDPLDSQTQYGISHLNVARLTVLTDSAILFYLITT